MATITEKVLKVEHDAWYANYIAQQAAGVQDYNIMMGNLEDPRINNEEDEINE